MVEVAVVAVVHVVGVGVALEVVELEEAFRKVAVRKEEEAFHEVTTVRKEEGAVHKVADRKAMVEVELLNHS